MVKRYHIGENGPGVCSASEGKCPFKDDDGAELPHYSSIEEAWKVYENQMSHKIFSSISKDDLSNLNENSWKKFGFKGHNFNRFHDLSDNETLKNRLDSQKVLSSLTEEEKESITFFSSSAFRDFNRVMYKRKPVDKSKEDEYKSIMNDLDNAIEKAPRVDKIVYRGLSGTASMFEEDFVNMENLFSDIDDLDDDELDSFFNNDKVDEYVRDNLNLGSEIEFSGYQSTSFSPSVASDYATGGILFEIKTPQGLNISSISNFSSEEEVLLPRSSRYKVVGVQKDEYQASNAKYIVQLIAINDEGRIMKPTDNSLVRTSWDDLTKNDA